MKTLLIALTVALPLMASAACPGHQDALTRLTTEKAAIEADGRQISNLLDSQLIVATRECEDEQKNIDAEKAKFAAEKEKSDKREAAEKALAAKPGVKIGMTASTVINKTSWGAPNLVNTTITKHGRDEQWVYGSGSYLYFSNGKLTAIQN